MGSIAKSQKQQHRVSALKSVGISQVLAADLGLKLISRDAVPGERFYIIFVKTTKLGHLLKSSLERMSSAQMGFLVSVQMKLH